jgi:hypothetical protein
LRRYCSALAGSIDTPISMSKDTTCGFLIFLFATSLSKNRDSSDLMN